MSPGVRPRRLLKDALNLLGLGVLRPLRDAWRTLRRRHPVRIFTFHRVTDLTRDTISVPPDAFRERIAYVARHHDVVDIGTALAAIRTGRRLRRPLAAITFDDGYRSVFQHARAILAERGVPACCFVATDVVGTDRRFAHDASSPVRDALDVMDWTELAALHSSGWGIGAHTATHRRLSECAPEEYRRELDAPLAELRKRLGLTDVDIAYPYGGPRDINARALEAITRAGYRACLSNFGGENFPGAALMSVKRFDIGGSHHDPLTWRARAHGLDLRALRRWLRRRGARTAPAY